MIGPSIGGLLISLKLPSKPTNSAPFGICMIDGWYTVFSIGPNFSPLLLYFLYDLLKMPSPRLLFILFMSLVFLFKSTPGKMNLGALLIVLYILGSN